MIGGKKIQNFITFQTKDTIFLKQNQPQLIVHQQTIETDSFKQLLSTKRSKNKTSIFQNPFRLQKQNRQSNEPIKRDDNKRSLIGSSNSKSKNTSKQRSLSSKYKHKVFGEKNVDHVKQFDLNFKENTKRSKSGKNKLSKKAKSMIRLPKYSEKNPIEQEKSKICRKSYSPNRNYSQGLKRTNGIHVNPAINKFQCSTQCIKTTKFTESKDTTIKHLKSTKTDRNIKKQPSENKAKNTKSKEKIKSNMASSKNLIQAKNYQTERRRDNIFNKFQVDKSKKMQKKVSPSKKIDLQKKKTEQKVSYKLPKDNKVIPKKRKSMSKSKKNIHFESVDDMLLHQQFNYDTARNETTGLANYLSGRDSFKKKVKTDRDSFNNIKPKKKHSVEQREKQKQVVLSSKHMKKLRNEAATKIQKVYKGYITRKWLGQYLKIINAAVIIQKYWRGYIDRKKVKFLFSKLNPKNIRSKEAQKGSTMPHVYHPTIQEQKSRVITFEDSKINIDRLKDILFEVMQEKTVNESLKSRIKHYLEVQGQSARSSMVSQRSQRSRNSEQKLQQEISSERRYFEKKHQKKQQLSNSKIKGHKYNNSSDSFSVVEQSDFQVFPSPSNRRSLKSSLKSSQLLSPQTLPISPKLSRAKSPQQIKSNLHQVQNIHRQKIISQAKTQKQQLQQLFQNKACSPRSYQLKQKQITEKLRIQLNQLDKNIKSDIEGGKQPSSSTSQYATNEIELTGKIIEAQSFNNEDSIMMTPEHSSVRQSLAREDFQNLSENQVMSKLFQKVENSLEQGGNGDEGIDGVREKAQQEEEMELIDLEFRAPQSVRVEVSPLHGQCQSQRKSHQDEQQGIIPTYQNFQTFNVNALSSQKSQPHASVKSLGLKMTKIDPSCNFLDEYLLTMIEYLRNKNDGKVMAEIVKGVKTWRNLEPYVVLRNLSIVNDQNNGETHEEDGFGLPLYKYLEDDAQIIRQDYVNDYNKYFNMMKQSDRFDGRRSKQLQKQNQAMEHYLKLLVDSFNEALNLKRPSTYMFTQRSIETFNSKFITSRQQPSDTESEYDMYCAGAMQQIFTWFNVKYGSIITSENQEDISMEQVMMQNAERLKLMMKMETDKKWDEYYEKIETLATIGEEIFEDLLIKEAITILNVERKFLKEREILK